MKETLGKYLDKLASKTLVLHFDTLCHGGRTRKEKDFGRDIGTKGERTNVAVTDNKTNKRITQFPKKPDE